MLSHGSTVPSQTEASGQESRLPGLRTGAGSLLRITASWPGPVLRLWEGRGRTRGTGRRSRVHQGLQGLEEKAGGFLEISGEPQTKLLPHTPLEDSGWGSVRVWSGRGGTWEKQDPGLVSPCPAGAPGCQQLL